MATKKVETKAADAVKDTAVVEVKKEVPAVKEEVKKAVPAVKEEVKRAVSAVKEEAKKPVPAVKEEAKKPVSAVKEEAVKAETAGTGKRANNKTPKKETEQKETVKKAPAGKASARKDPKTTVVVEYGDKKVVTKTILDQASKAFAKANKGVEIKTIDVYIKPEENVAYYVVNGVGSPDYKVGL